MANDETQHASLDKPLIGKGGMASCIFDKKFAVWQCEVGDTKFKTKSMEISPKYEPNAIGLISHYGKGLNEGEIYMSGYALGKVECSTLYGTPDPDTEIYGKTICRILPLPPEEKKAYLEGYGK